MFIIARYRVRFFFDWGCLPLWCGDDETAARFGYAIQPEKLPLSIETIKRTYHLASWYDTALNWDYPPDPSPWRQPECDRFNEAVKQLFESIRAELGEEFELIDEQCELHEDPDLDEYLKRPKEFGHRNKEC